METVTKLREIYEALKAQDPLLQRGILREWVCVVNPQMERLLLDTYPERNPFNPHFLTSDKLASITGRITYVTERAPRYELEYMSESELIQRYPEVKGLRGYKQRFAVTSFVWHVPCWCGDGYLGAGFERCDDCWGSGVRLRIYCKAYTIHRLRCLRWRKGKIR